MYMFRSPRLSELMCEELPNIAYQRRLSFRTNEQQVIDIWKVLNKTIFDGKLSLPIIEVVPRCRQYWGICIGEYYRPKFKKSYCKIRVMDKWYCKQWLITTLAHEMCHQYQWDILGEERKQMGLEPIMSHGPSFYIFRDRLAKYGIPLKRHHRVKRWFKHQDMMKA